MNKPLSIFAIALSLAAIASPALAGSSRTPTLDEVTAQAGVRHIEQISCAHESWPTQGQVATDAGVAPEEAAVLRRHILKSGRALCWQGYTHVRVVYKQSGEVAVVLPAPRAARGS